MVFCYTTDETINQFSIVYMINSSLKFKNTFRTQAETFSSVSFSDGTMKAIKNCLMKKNTFVMALLMIYENTGEIPKQMYRVLSCAVYSLIENYACIEYLSSQSKILSAISFNPTFEDTSVNILLGICIPELLLNLVSCHGCMNKTIQL